MDRGSVIIGDRNADKKNCHHHSLCLCCLASVVSRSSNQRLALVDRLTKRRSLLTDSDDIVLNFVEDRGSQSEGWPLSDSFHKEAEGKMPKSKS